MDLSSGGFWGALICIYVVGSILLFITKPLFQSYFISTIISLALTVVSIVLGFIMMKTFTSGETVGTAYYVSQIIITSFAYLFFIGPVVFKVKWDGTYTLKMSGNNTGTLKKNYIGGFAANASMAVIVSFVFYCILAPNENMYAFYIVLPFVILALNLKHVITMIVR